MNPYTTHNLIAGELTAEPGLEVLHTCVQLELGRADGVESRVHGRHDRGLDTAGQRGHVHRGAGRRRRGRRGGRREPERCEARARVCGEVGVGRQRRDARPEVRCGGRLERRLGLLRERHDRAQGLLPDHGRRLLQPPREPCSHEADLAVVRIVARRDLAQHLHRVRLDRQVVLGGDLLEQDAVNLLELVVSHLRPR